MEAEYDAASGGESLFEKVRRLANSKLENHIHVNAVLEAATEVIKQKGIYFGCSIFCLSYGSNSITIQVDLRIIPSPILAS